MENANSVTEIVNSIEFMEEFHSGNIRFKGKEIIGKINQTSSFGESIKYWKAILELEKLMQHEFKYNFPFDSNNYLWIERLIVSVVYKRAYIYSVRQDSLELSFSKYPNFDDSKSEIILNMIEQKNIELVDKEITLHSIIVIAHSRIKQINHVGDEYIVILEPVESKSGIKLITKDFLSEAEAENEQKWINSSINDNIKEYTDAMTFDQALIDILR